MMAKPIMPAMVVIFTSHPNTTAELLPRLKYTRGRKISETPTATYGVPNRFVFRKIFGACLSSARPYKVREDRKIQADPQLNAEVQTTALIIEGRTLIPAR